MDPRESDFPLQRFPLGMHSHIIRARRLIERSMEICTYRRERVRGFLPPSMRSPPASSFQSAHRSGLLRRVPPRRWSERGRVWRSPSSIFPASSGLIFPRDCTRRSRAKAAAFTPRNRIKSISIGTRRAATIIGSRYDGAVLRPPFVTPLLRITRVIRHLRN